MSTVTVGEPALLERDREFERLWDSLRSVRARSGRIVLVSGEAGIGKTSLVRSFCDDASTRARIRWGACDPHATPRPLGPFADIARDLPGPLRGLIDAAAPVEALFEALRAALADRPVPTVVVIEDLHWADEATLDLLRFLGRRVAATRSLVLLTHRDDEIGRDHPLRLLLGDLAGSPAVDRIPLAPLSPTATAALASERAVDAARLHTITGGNPFFVTEVLAASGPEELPVTVRDAVLARAAGLTPDQRAVVDAAALARPPVPVALVLAASRADADAVDAVVSAGVLVARPDGLAFRHELARRAIEGDVPPGRRAELHAAVLAWLEAQPMADPSDLAHHAEGSGNRAAVLRYAPAAATHASALGAHREAAAQYARALRWSEGLAAIELVPLLEGHSLESMIADDIEAAVASRERAVELRRSLGDRVALGDSLRWFSRLLWVAGRNQDAEAAGVEALALLETEGPGYELAMAHSNRAQLAMLGRDLDAAIAHGHRAIELAETLTQGAEVVVHALNNVGTAEYMAGRGESGRPKIERSLELARSAGLHDHAARALCNLGSATGELREYAVAEPYLEQGIVFCADHQQDYFGHYLEAWWARCHFEQGRWREAEEVATAVLDRPGLATVTRIVVLTVLGRLGVRRGSPGGRALLDEAWSLAGGTGDLQRTWPVAAGRAEAAWLVGDTAAIADAVGDTYDLAAGIEHPWAVGELGYWLWRAGRTDSLPAYAADPFRREVAGDARAAGAAWRELGCPYEQALAWSEADDEEGLRRAFELAEELGAAPLADRVAQRLRERGVHGFARRGRPTVEPGELTARQSEVLALLVEGLRDADIAERLFISPKTAGHHVSAILARLGVSSRAEAVAEAHRRGLVT